MKLNASFPVREVAGHWDNNFEYLGADGEKKLEQYIITFLADYTHMFFHISIAVDSLNDQFINELDNIMYRTNEHNKNLKNTVLGGSEIHFTGKVFIVTNSEKGSYPNLVDSFKSKGISTNIYHSTDNTLEMVSPVISYIPLHNFEQSVVKGEKTPIFTSANYTIFEESDGAISYAYHANFTETGISNTDVLKQLSQLSPEQDNFRTLLTSEKLRKKHNLVYATALRDVFEGHLGTAKASLKLAADTLYKKKVGTNTLFALFFYFAVLLAIFLSETYISKIMDGLGNVVFFSVLGGCFSLFTTFSYFKQSGNHSKVELLVDLLVKSFITGISGLLVYFVIRSNLILGFLNSSSIYSIYLLAFISGWSEKFASNLLTSIEQKFSAEIKT